MKLCNCEKSLESENKWIPIHEIFKDLLARDPGAHLATVVLVYAAGAKIPSKEARPMINAIKKAEIKDNRMDLGGFQSVVIGVAIDNLEWQAAI